MYIWLYMDLDSEFQMTILNLVLFTHSRENPEGFEFLKPSQPTQLVEQFVCFSISTKQRQQAMEKCPKGRENQIISHIH